MTVVKAQEPVTPAPEHLVVTPAANYQLNHDGTIVGPGESITVPADVAAKWAAQGLISLTAAGD